MRIKTFEESAHKDREATKRMLLTLVADSTNPSDPRRRRRITDRIWSIHTL